MNVKVVRHADVRTIEVPYVCGRLCDGDAMHEESSRVVIE
jgi:hypothetical protein